MNPNNFYYATSKKHLERAAKYGIKNVVVDSRGHGGGSFGKLKDDQLCLMKKYNRIYKARKPFAREIRR